MMTNVWEEENHFSVLQAHYDRRSHNHCISLGPNGVMQLKKKELLKGKGEKVFLELMEKLLNSKVMEKSLEPETRRTT
ncbi:hypothetical protein MTO96_035212 [Rhipicephalus appendiculatus]